jgi:hypothetical protein
MSEVTKNILYTLYADTTVEHAETAVQLRQWIDDNGLDASTSQIEPGPFTDVNGHTHNYVAQFSLTAPCLVEIKKVEGSDDLTCTVIANGADAILNLSAGQIDAMKAAYAETTKAPTQIKARRIG